MVSSPDATDPGTSDPHALESTVLPDRGPAEGSAEHTGDGARRAAAGDLATPGQRVGRFALLRRIGAGAMGVVWAAYDEVLDRRVAIKLVRPDRLISRADRERMLREARAMARLSHANIVQVYDAGDDQGRVFVAMELVGGGTLRAWMGQPRPWPAVVGMFRGIASGLAAAHAAGVIHRDLKPENVMIDALGVPKVADFGLADLGGQYDTTEGDEPLRSGEPVPELTATGAVIGTPAYMAPEQHRGQPATAQSDQFALCVALWEALHGERPFSGPNVAALTLAVCQGRRAPPVRDVPAWLQRLVDRGLALEPAERWPTMTALAGALGHQHGRGRTRVVAGAAVLALAGGVAWAVRAPEPCTGAREQLAGSWDDDRRARLAGAFTGVGASFADETWARIGPALDAWTDAWVDAHQEACRATSVRREQSAAVMDLRMACLGRARASLDAVTAVLERVDGDTLARADELVAGLAVVDRCADVDALQADVGLPDEHERAAVALAHAELANIDALVAAGRLDDARSAVDALAVGLRAVDYPPVHAELLLARAHVLDQRNDNTAAAQVTREALAAALHTGQRELARRAVVDLMRIIGSDLSRPGDAAMLTDVARGLTGEGTDERAALEAALGAVHVGAGEYDAALEAFARALTIREADPSSSRRELVRARFDLATAMRLAGRVEEAREEFTRSIALVEAEFGAGHPDVAVARSSLANALIAAGRIDEALAELRAALAIAEATVGTDSDLGADLRQSLGVAYLRSGRPADAEREMRAAILARERRLGPDNAKVGLERGTLGFALQEQGRLDEAADEIAKGLAIASAALGPNHPDVIGLRNNHGSLLHALGRDHEALAEHRACAAARTEVLGADHPDTATSHYNIAVVSSALERWTDVEAETAIALPIYRARLGDDHRLVHAAMSLRGQALLELGRVEEAVAALESAWKGQDRPDLPARKKAETVFALARALGSSPTEHARAKALGQRARALFVEIGSDGAERVQAADTWLQSR